MSIAIQSAGFLTTIQDLGRFGYEKFGVSSSGPMDRFALRAANLLVGNDKSAAGLEFGIADLDLTVGDDCLIAVTGAGYDLFVNGQRMPLWMSIFVRRGTQVHARKVSGGNWGYLAVSCGIAVQKLMGSRSTYLKGKFGGLDGAPLQDGDVLPICPQPDAFHGFSGRMLPQKYQPDYHESPTLAVVSGPQDECFTEKGMETFLNQTYRVSATSDRMGYRLEGQPVEHLSGADILSDGMCFGSVQVPASGQPIIMMSEHPTTGGYAKIATVVNADLPVLAQCTPGVSQVSFRTTTVEEAQQRYRSLIAGMENFLQQLEEDDLNYIE